MKKLSMQDLNRKTVDAFRSAEKIPLIAVMENVRSAYNVGSLFRTADAFLIEAVYLCGYTAFPPHKEIRKTALGAEETVAWKHFPSIAEAIAELRLKEFEVWAVEQAEASVRLEDFEQAHNRKLAVIFGNEVNGVEQETIALCSGCIEIPQLGMKHSLNVSVAAGVVLWELVRPRLIATQ